MTDQVEIYNMALDAAGQPKRVASPTEASVEAEACQLWYPQVRRRVLNAAWWGCARATARLALLATRDETANWTTGDPLPTYKYAYELPTSYLRARFLADFSRFEIALRNGSRALHTNKAQALLIYSVDQTDISEWDAELRDCIIYGLGAAVANSLNGSLVRAQENEKKSNDYIMQARAIRGNEDEARHETLPSWIQARGYGMPTANTSRFYYPFGPVLSVTGGVSAN